jgi:hypothetical protein
VAGGRAGVYVLYLYMYIYIDIQSIGKHKKMGGDRTERSTVHARQCKKGNFLEMKDNFLCDIKKVNIPHRERKASWNK